MSRLPIRWKLTLAFALALAIVLTGVGVFLHFQLSTDVDNDIERDLRARADQLSGLVIREPIGALTSPSKTLEPDETIAQILTRTAGWWRPVRPACCCSRHRRSLSHSLP